MGRPRPCWRDPFGHIFLGNSDEVPAAPASTAPGHAPIDDPTKTTATSAAIEICSSRPTSNEHWPEADEAESLLTEYKKNLAHLFPFVVVPPNTRAYELRRQKPFFWKAVMMEALHNDGARQIALGNELLREISEAAIVRPQRGLDLLQGLQVFISWWVVAPPSSTVYPLVPC